MKARFDHIADYLAQADQLRLASLPQLRQKAANDLQHYGFPALKTETWKYTNARALLQTVYQVASNVSLTQKDLAPYVMADAHNIIFVNGFYQAALSQFDAAEIRLVPITEAGNLPGKYLSTAQVGFTALNTLLFADGYFLTLQSLSKPLQILHVATQILAEAAIYNRNLLIVAENSNASVIEQFVSLDEQADYWRNTTSEIVLQHNAKLNYFKLQQESTAAKHTHFNVVQQEHTSQFISYNVDLGGALVRNDLQVKLAAEQARCELYGIYLLRNKQHIDNHTEIDHVKPFTYSKEFYKGIITDHAHGVFNGRVIVQPDAQKIDSQQNNANLLLSKHCEIDTKPELEIYADDVKCTHGTTVGQLDAAMVFYLQSRGIEKSLAEKLLTFGFANEVLEIIADPQPREYCMRHLAHWFVNDRELKELML